VHPRKRLLTVAIALYALAWMLPSVRGGGIFHWGVLPGWQATRFALDPIWPWPPLQDSFSRMTWLQEAIGVATALTNVLFLLGALLAVRWPHGASRSLSRDLLLAAWLNSAWFFWMTTELGAGYYLWVASFILLAGAVKLPQSRPAAGTNPMA
jgi:hypothetical protein